MKPFYSCLLFLTAFFFQAAKADLYSETLIQNKTKTENPSEAGLQSGRYQIKNDQKEEVVYPTKKKQDHQKEKFKKRPASDSPALPITTALPVAPQETENKAEPVAEPSVKDQVTDIFSGGKKKLTEIYREQIHPDDIRMNRLEVDIGSGFFYNSSIANFAYRKYLSFAPNLTVGARVWLTPLVGISGKYQTTYGEDVAATTNVNNRVPIKSEWIELSLDFRKFYGFSRRANNLQYGLLYSEYKFSPPADDGTRIRLKSSGVGLYLRSRFPVAPSYSWTFGGELFPILSHSELATAINLLSGTSVSSSRIGIHFGGEFKLSRQNQIIWDLGVKIERNQYSGAANMTDPDTGTTPSNVSVTNTWSLFQLGYRWGQ